MTASDTHANITLPPELASQFVSDGHGSLLLRATRSIDSGELFYPPRLFIGDDMQPATDVLIPSDGKVNCTTRVRVRPPYGLPPGYMIGFVDLNAAPFRLFGLFAPEFADDIVAGSLVHLQLRQMGTDNDSKPCLRPVFVPLTETQS